MYNTYSKLRGRIREKVGTVSNLAKKTGISSTTITKKLTLQVPFTQTDIVKICDAINIVTFEIVDYFFGDEVRNLNNETRKRKR